MSDDAVKTALHLLDEVSTGALGTLTGEGYPMASLVAYAVARDGAPLFLISSMAFHTKNLNADPRASLLIRDETSGDALARARVTLLGTVSRLAETDIDDARTRFLARHPQAATYVGFADFSFHKLKIERAHLVAGFGRIVEIPGKAFARAAG
ncbi:MAG: pyridoxamine 5'-phosphate oxidase family protein [Parvibaculum sp.]|uniref:HugZ family pyridoxamine 5'-phosphate oxidase n=1 Tax=Parvibaculum sp. TaxID=2024848 RepID=UPI0025E63424|nr:pyridoxamine 5'-phosphate oxidase family protein [Parvibaculum sp.]MCE9648301.1 pyridoxamine 5'-phosphate oxidase family protein [Parvibaculum sp.]